jgi:predicted regulator of Ras-like GTPase activity (Roadblock/LC7/MglB family)
LNPLPRPEAPAKEPVKEVAETESKITSEATPATKPEPEATSSLFGKGVDSDVDDIFSNLAPAEAQREFDPNLVNKEEPPVVSEQETPSSNLFGAKVDAEVDDIFSSLAPEEAQKPFKKPEPESEPEATFSPPAQAPAPKPVAKAAKDGIFDESVNDELDDIFSNLAPAEAQMTVKDKERIIAQEEAQEEVHEEVHAEVQEESVVAESFAPETAEPEPVIPVAQEESFAPQEAEQSFEPAEPSQSEGMVINPVTKNKEVKEFGRLSSRTANVTGQAQPTVGTMKTIGKLLLDVQAIENIIKSGEEGTIGAGLTNARVISAQRGEGIKALLNKIDSYSGVVGSLIVGHDGLVIASTVGTGMDKDILGALSTALLSTSNLATLKLDIGKLRQMVMLTDTANGSGARPVTTVLTDVEVGILAVFLDSQDLEQVDGLLVAIHETIHG